MAATSAQVNGDSGASVISEDELFELLANPRRRHILYTLIEEDQPLEIGQLAQEIAALEDGMDPEQVSSTDRKRVYTALQQSHLPRMDRAGIIEFDSDRGTLVPTTGLEEVEAYMDVLHGDHVDWSVVYLALAVTATLLLGGVATGIWVLESLSLELVSGGIVTAFGLTAIGHWLYTRRNRLHIEADPLELIARDA